MARPVEAVSADLSSLLPLGWVWNRDANSELAKVQGAMARGIADVEAAAARFNTEIDPGQAALLLEDFERVLGPDPCRSGDIDLTDSTRRLIAYQRWTARGGQSAAYFIALAAAYGVTITIDTDITECIGEMECGDEIICSPEQFVWRVNLPTTQEFDPLIGEFDTGDLLGWLVPNLVECVIRRAAPAHTFVVFNYA